MIAAKSIFKVTHGFTVTGSVRVKNGRQTGRLNRKQTEAGQFQAGSKNRQIGKEYSVGTRYVKIGSDLAKSHSKSGDAG